MCYENLPNFIPCIQYLIKKDKMTYAVALYMLSYIDLEDSDLCDGAVCAPDDDIFDDSFRTLLHSFECYYIDKKLGSVGVSDFTSIFSYPVKQIDEDQANIILNNVQTLKENGLCNNYFNNYFNVDKEYKEHYENTVKILNSIIT